MFFLFKGAGGRGNVVDVILGRSIHREHSVKHDGGEIKLKNNLVNRWKDKRKLF